MQAQNFKNVSIFHSLKLNLAHAVARVLMCQYEQKFQRTGNLLEM